MGTHYLGIDVGTSGTKALLMEESGRVVVTATEEYPLHVPKPNWSEQDPEDWWRATVGAVRAVLENARVAADSVKGVGLSGQMHGSVFLDAADRVIRPAILWNDQRTGAECAEITERIGAERLLGLVSNPALTGFTAPKILWLRKHEPENYRKVRKVLLPKDYIRFRLTGEFATEVSDASGTLLFDVRNRRWSDTVLEELEIPGDWMPPAVESPEVTGRVRPEVAEELGLPVGTPVVGGGGDQAAGAVGNGIVEPGVVSAVLGTSGVVFAYSDSPETDPRGRLHTFCHAVPGKWHQMGVMLSAGGSFRWFRDVLGQEEVTEAQERGLDPYAVLTERAEKAPPGAEGLLFLPYLAGERTPYPDPNARGVYVGLSLRHGKAHLVRSVLEGVAFGLRDSLEILRDLGVPIRQIRVSGGGARSPLWRQILANVFGLPVVTTNAEEGPAYGVALLAAVGTGNFSSVPEACRTAIKVVSQTDPDPGTVELYEAYYGVYRSLYPTLKGIFPRLAELSVKHVGS